MDQAKVKDLKKGWCVNHPKFGNVQYRGLATKHPYTDAPKIPYTHVFWQSIDEGGNAQPDVLELNGNLVVEITDKFEDND